MSTNSQKKQKVVTVNVLSRVGNSEKDFKELEFPKLEEHLNDGFFIKDVYQIAPSPQLYVVTITFILEKNE